MIVIKEEPLSSEFWATWRLVPFLTLRQAAWLLAGQDPAYADDVSSQLPSSVRAISLALDAAAGGTLLPICQVHEGGRSRNIYRDAGDPLSAEVSADSLARWADANGLAHAWMRPQALLDGDFERFPAQLKLAIKAFNAVFGSDLGGKTPKQALVAWVSKNTEGLSEPEKNRIAQIANWQPEGGVGRTPTGRSSDSESDTTSSSIGMGSSSE